MKFKKIINPPKYLRYLFYVGYSWYRSYTSERTDAHNTAILFLIMPHIGFMYGLCFITGIENRILENILVLLLPFVLSYLWFWKNEKWRRYINEFNYVKAKKRKKHIIYLFLYMVLSILFALFPVILYELFNIRI